MTTPIPLAKTWPVLRLDAIASIERNSIQAGKILSGTKYAGLEHILSDEGEINSIAVQVGDIASNKFVYDEGHILYGKLRPYLRKIAIPKEAGVCSTDILPIRPGERLDKSFLYHYLRLPQCVEYATTRSSGANLPRLSPKELAAFPTPLPPLSEQKRIAAILDKADAIRRKRKAALNMANEFLRATFLDLFGDPVTNPKGWDVKPFGKLIKTIRNGLSPSSKGTHPGTVFTLSAVTGPDFLPSAKKAALFDKDPSAYQAKPSDFLICRGNGNLKLVGKAKFPKGDFKATAFPDTIIAADVDTQTVLPEVLEAQWATFFIRDQIERGARTTNGTYKINQSVIKSIKVVTPDIKAQLAFRDQVKGLGLYLSKIAEDQSSILFESLSQRAFRGEL